MAFFLKQIARMAVQKLATDPVAREQATKAARAVSDEAKKIAKQENKAYATGRSVRRALNKLQGKT